MTKLSVLCFMLAGLMYVPVQALENVSLTGEIQVISSDVRNNAAQQFNSGTNLRVLAGASAVLAEEVKASLLFQYANTWGQGGAGNANFGTSGAAVQDYWNTVALVEGNVVLSDLFGGLEAKIGRQFYGDESSAVMYFGPTHYISESNLATSIDALKLTAENEHYTLTLLGGKAAYQAPLYGQNTREEDASLFGADLVWDVAPNAALQVYGYDFRNVSVSSGGGVSACAHYGFYGTKANYAPSDWIFSAEYARNFRGNELLKEENGAAGYMFKGDAKVVLEGEKMTFTPRGAFIYSANEFRAHGNYSAGIFIGDNYGDIFTYYANQGVRMYNIGLDLKLSALPKWTFLLDGYALQDRSAQASASYEGDLIIKYAHNTAVELFAGVAYIKNGSYNKTVRRYSSENAKGQVGMLVRF